MIRGDIIPDFNDFGISYADTYFDNYPEPLEHYHNTYEIALFLKADLRIFVNDTGYSLTDGDILFINENDLHRMVYAPNHQYTRYVISFSSKFIVPYLKTIGLEWLLETLSSYTYKKVSLNMPKLLELEALFKELIKLDHKLKQGKDLQLTSALIKSYILIILSRLQDIMKTASFSINPLKKDKQVQEIVKFINARYMDEINLDLLEKNFNLSKFHISHIFKEITGFTVVEYLQHKRVMESCKMLRNSGKSVIDICYCSGFSNLRCFYRVFRKITGMTPNKFRSQG